MPTAARPDFSLSNGVVLIGDVGLIGGQLDIFCCAREISFEQTAETEEVICDRLVGIADRIDHTPRATVTLQELNFNTTVLERALGMVTTYNTTGYRVMGNGDNPNTVPTELAQVDGPHAPAYVGNFATVALNNALISGMESASEIAWVNAWTRNPDGTFTIAAAFDVDYAHANTNLATGEIYFTAGGADPTPLYFTYRYMPVTPGSAILQNPWSTFGNTDVWIRIIHEHGNGVDLVIADFWRARARPDTTIQLKTVSGDNVVPVELVFDVFADKRYHPDSPLYEITFDVIGRTTTPEYGCDGAAWATPIAT